MIKIIAIDKQYNILLDIPLQRVKDDDILWYWVDFDDSGRDELIYLSTFFDYHELQIEDTLTRLQRPKVEISRHLQFFVLHILTNNSEDEEYQSLNMFLSDKGLVTVHFAPLKAIERAREKVLSHSGDKYVPIHLAHMMMDTVIESYYPKLYTIADRLDELEEGDAHRKGSRIMDEVFDLRADLLHLRRTVTPTRELVHRMLMSRRMELRENDRKYFLDIYDDLVQQTETIEALRELTADIRENYISYNSFKSNNIMMILTMVSAIFLPLTFIAGVYGMNFKFMPELDWHYGYFITWAIMIGIVVGMVLFFKKRGWFDLFK